MLEKEKDNYKNLFMGSIFISVACACWAYSFIVPIVLKNYSSSEISIFRYLFYGFFSGIFYLTKNKKGEVSLKEWFIAFIFALIGNTLYYSILIIGIDFAGAGISVAIAGMVPITVALLGNLILKEYKMSKIIFPLFISLCGVMIINYTNFISGGNFTKKSFLGIVACIISLILWSCYGVANSEFLKKNRNIDSAKWTNMIGIMCFVQAIIWGGLELKFNSNNFCNFTNVSNIFILCFWTASLGIISSWLATIMWNIGSEKLPVTLAGQIIVMEPICGLVYVFLVQRIIPSYTELIGYTICILGVILTLKKIK